MARRPGPRRGPTPGGLPQRPDAPRDRRLDRGGDSRPGTRSRGTPHMSVATEPLLDGDAILARARAASAILRDEASESERARRLTPTAVDALRATGVFRMAMPRSWGGPEVDP